METQTNTKQQSQVQPQPMIYGKIADAMAHIEAIGKERQNVQQGYRFRGVDDCYNMIHPVLAKHRIFSVPTILKRQQVERQSSGGKPMMHVILEMQYRFYAEDGSFVDAIVVGEGMDSGDKAHNKAMAVAHKYAITQTFAIPTEDAKDPENDSPELSGKTANEKRGDPKPKGETKRAAKSESGASEKGKEFLKRLNATFPLFLKQYPQAKLPQVLQKLFGVAELKALKPEQGEDLIRYLEHHAQGKNPAGRTETGNRAASNPSGVPKGQPMGKTPQNDANAEPYDPHFADDAAAQMSWEREPGSDG